MGAKRPGRCDPTPLPSGPSAGCRPLPHSTVFVILFALITTLVLCSSSSASEVSRYSSPWGRIRQPVNLKKWSITDGYISILAHKTSTKLGPEVKQAECTIRMNDTPTMGYSDHLVGNKTTFRVVAHSRFINQTSETLFIFWGLPNKMQMPQDSLVCVIQRAGLVFPNMEAYIISLGCMTQEESYSWLSTAWFTVVTAQPLLQRMPYHRYEPKKGNHPHFIRKKRVFSCWAQLYGITFS
ncbi:hypothetical protein FD754_006337 [Muntiacus muntjak]|uniref:Uncharacterized protein n=1 Tax=Muntiacus muntjak TaxID=9888 RepID=A0A5N3WKA6_MUNMU|nr:hypothetical protein FD754_006337 [Muntiacus muntjak]